MRILAVLNRPDNAPAVLAAAGLLGGTVTTLHVRDTGGEIPGEEIVPAAERSERDGAAEVRSAALRALAGAGWREVSGKTRVCVAEACRTADLAVMGRPPPHFYEDMHEALRGALLDAGAPVLLLDAAVPDRLGAHIALAWKPGAEAAVSAAMPLLRKAKFVTVLIGDDDGAEAALPDALLDTLERDGVEHAVHVFRPDASIGAALGREALSLGADLLVMGAFSHGRTMGRMRERVFGGATQEVISGAVLPVLLRH